jgi:hypothetical protein
MSVSFSPDGSRIASGSDDQTIRLWDAKSGQQLSVEKKRPEWAKDRSQPGAISPDGKFIWLGEADGRIIRVPLEITPAETQFRKAMWRPDPIWHRQQLEAAKKANDPFAERVQNYLLHRAIAQEHFEYNRWDQAFVWYAAAELLKPNPLVIDWPEALAKPKELGD